jgi:hypothetical protein
VAAVGFNPFGRQVRRRSDAVIVAVAFAVILALVAWALLPR